VSIAEQNFNPDDIYIEGEDRGMAHRAQMGEISRLLKYIYCTDSVLDRAEDVVELTNHNVPLPNN
jgi:hypothetical protein